jgi:antitoxin YefM
MMWELTMKSLSSKQASGNLDRIIEETAQSREPIEIRSQNATAVLISEQEWRSIQETLYLTSIPGMKDSIIEGAETPIEDCIKEEDLEW